MPDSNSIRSEFERLYSAPPRFLAQAPGRVNLIGEHTDYNLGNVLPMAIDRSVRIGFMPRDDSLVNLYSMNFEQAVSFQLDAPITGDKSASWSDYIKGVAQALLNSGRRLRGFDAVITGDIPVASGLSSSAAVEIAAALTFAQSSGFQFDNPLETARTAQWAEQNFVGVNCGIMDQFISAAARAGHALRICCDTMDYDPVKLPDDAVIFVGDTKASRALAGSAYNQRRKECEQALDMIRNSRVGEEFDVRTMRDVNVTVVEASRSILPDVLLRRCRHVATENERVLATATALETNDLERAGQLFNASHASLRDDYEVSSKELNTMVDCMRSQRSCLGARLTGAGFGGCAIALVERNRQDSFAEKLAELYQQRTGIQAEVFPVKASAGASVSSM